MLIFPKKILSFYENDKFLRVYLPVFYCLLFLVTLLFAGLYRFSNDSWSLYELSRTIFKDNFYEFSTYRSYFSDVKSASFPFGYPILLALFSKILGENPVNAIILNILISGISINILAKLLKNLNFSKWFNFVGIISLICNPTYIDEILSGRPIPAAIFFILLSLVLINKNLFLGGLTLGIATLIRFDFIVISFLIIILFSKKFILIRESKFLIYIFGFLTGLAPWIIFSMLYFGKFWISDNSWVSIAVDKAFVLDFPAEAELTIFQAPLRWLYRVINNIPLILKVFFKSSLYTPISALSLISFIRIYSYLKNYNKINIFLIVITLFLFTSAYLFTGYVDSRYFSPLLLVSTIFALKGILKVNKKYREKFRINFLLSLSLSFSLLMSITFLSKIVFDSKINNRKLIIENNLIEKVDICHKKEPSLTYVFMKDSFGFNKNLNPFKYGAITLNKTAVIPNNFMNLNDENKLSFFKKLNPYRKIDLNENPEEFSCK